MPQVVWITGASSGIGEAMAIEFARRGGFNLVLSARRNSELERVKGICIEHGMASSEVLVLPFDIVDTESHGGLANRVAAEFGQIDMLINNAGVSQRSWCVDTDLTVYRKLFEIDVFGQISLTKAVLPIMLAQQSGHIAVTSSVAGKIGAPLRTGYSMAKHAVMGFFDALRCEIAHEGIHVSTITPGSIQSQVSVNAFAGNGEAFGIMDQEIENGMPAAKCADIVVSALLAKQREIPVGEGSEMDLLPMKRQDPEAMFDLLESMTANLRKRGIY
jgi:short-subunit dehydrogenase